jgi:carbamoylphosphate synthase large subunit
MSINILFFKLSIEIKILIKCQTCSNSNPNQDGVVIKITTFFKFKKISVDLKGQAYKKVCEIMTEDARIGLN